MTSHRKIEKRHVVRNGAVVLTSAAIIGTGSVLIVEQHNQPVTQSVKAATYDINGYIKKNKVQPKKTIVKDLHNFSVFDYSTPDKLPNGIVFHWTASESLKDSARAEADYEINGGWNRAFVHTFIDDKQILNIHDTNKGVWGAGPKANARFVQFEMCTAANEKEFAQTITNAAYYTAYILYQYGLKPTLGPDGSIWTHHQVSLYLGGTTHVDPDEYLSRWNYNTSKFLTLVKQYYAPMVAKKAYSSAIHYDNYVTVTSKKATIWGDLDFKKKRGSSSTYYNQTLHAKAAFGRSGSHYLSLYDKSNKWVGYLNASCVQIEKGGQGKAISYGKYVTIVRSTANLWSSFSWAKTGKTTADIFNKTYLAKVEYKHFNGSTYLSLYDKKGKWLGYVNKTQTKEGSSQGGAALPISEYVSVTANDYTVWRDLNGKKKLGISNSLQGKTLIAKAQYNHFNGSKYYSLYDHNSKWQGYINATGVKKTVIQGPYKSIKKYVTLKKSGYPIWRNLNFTKKLSNTSYQLNKTFLAKCEFNHFDGNTYYSLYNASGVWQGYVDKAATATGSTAGGSAYVYNKQVTIQRNYPLWKDFEGKQKLGTTAKLQGQTVLAKYLFHHINGSTYYSLYDNTGKWMGFVNAAVSEEPDVTVTPITVPANLYGVKTTSLNASQKKFLKQLIAIAIPVAKKYGLYPSIMVMQGVKESAWGTSELATKANAYFGVKADTNWLGSTYTKVTAEQNQGQVSAAFRKYGSLAASVEDYARNIVAKPEFYSGALRKNAATWEAAVNGLKPYATSTTYLSDLKSGIKQYQFNKLDSIK